MDDRRSDERLRRLESLGIGGQRRPTSSGAEALRRGLLALEGINIDPTIPERELSRHFHILASESRAFSVQVVGVEDEQDTRNKTSLKDRANDFARWRRQQSFVKRIRSGDTSPVIVAEGDSWFHFPIFLRDIVMQLSSDHLIWSIGAAGATLANMLEDQGAEQREYVRAIDACPSPPRAFMFSGGGNDMLGKNADGSLVLMRIVKPYEPRHSVEWHIDTPDMSQKLRYLESSYRRVIADVRLRDPNMPVVMHGYDYCYPCPYDADDKRKPPWIRRDAFLGAPLRELGFLDPALQRAVISAIIDATNDVQRRLCGGNVPGGIFNNAFHVDCRGAVPAGQWADEIHPTDEGYGRAALRFRDVMQHVLGA
jgi:hypothetical protein